jgi:hypothetical protein
MMGKFLEAFFAGLVKTESIEIKTLVRYAAQGAPHATFGACNLHVVKSLFSPASCRPRLARAPLRHDRSGTWFEVAIGSFHSAWKPAR